MEEHQEMILSEQKGETKTQAETKAQRIRARCMEKLAVAVSHGFKFENIEDLYKRVKSQKLTQKA